MDIGSLVALCQAALAGTLKTVSELRSRRLSSHERDLLHAAAENGEFFLLSAGQIASTWVRAGGKDFIDTGDSADPAYAAHYMDAFRSLCERGYVLHEGGQLFVLTGEGFDRARSLG